MITEVKLPSGHLGKFPVVSLDTDMTGEHHEMLLSSSPKLFERTLASVIGSLMQVGSVYDIGIIDLMYLFFIVRSASISPVYKTKWKCSRQVGAGREKGDCGHENPFLLNLAKIKTSFVPKGYEYKKYPVKIDGIDSKIWVKMLKVSDEFDVLDFMAEQNITKDVIASSPGDAYKYARQRLLTSLAFEDARLDSYDLARRDQVLKALPFNTVNNLFADGKALNSFGPDLSPVTVTCEKCKGESRLSIPFSSQLLLPD
jgi:hypothetical protein